MDTKEPEVLSDNDVGERPVREQLKKTTIDGLSRPSTDDGPNNNNTQQQQPADLTMHSASSPSKTTTTTNGAGSENGSEEGRGRSIKKKRSFDDLERGDDPEVGETGETTTAKTEPNGSLHKRKRSRDIQVGDLSGSKELSRPPPTERLSEGDEAPSPKSVGDADVENNDELEEEIRRKRSREDAERSGTSDTAAGAAEKDVSSDKMTAKDASSEPAKTIEKSESTKIPPTSGFANSSSVSPFAALAASKSPEPSSSAVDKPTETTSSSAFASSGLAAFAGDKSPFGTLGGTSSSSGFGTLGGSEKPKLTSFASASSGGFASAGTGGFGGSAFATAGSSGFGSTLGGGSAFGGSAFGGAKSGGLSSFASPSGPTTFGGGKPAKPFGAPVRGDESDNENDDEETSQDNNDPDDPDHRDERFYQQDVETGEEHEETLFATRSKLFGFDGKEWKERGTGVFKLNITPPPEDQPEAKQTARFIMRAEGVLRVILNTPVFKSMDIGGPHGGEPTSKTLAFPMMEGGKPVPLLLRISDPEKVKDLYQKVKDLQKEM